MKKWMYTLLLAAMVCGGLFAGCRKEVPLELPSQEEIEEVPEEETAQAEEAGELPPIWVDICGEVRRPGVYEMTDGDRLYQIVEKAGGMTEEAQPVSVNLARQLVDGEQIYVYSRKEYEALPEAETPVNPLENAAGKININTASAEELTALSGIGPAKAAAIVAYREENGGFSEIEQIREVDGVGDGTYQKIKDEIAVS